MALQILLWLYKKLLWLYKYCCGFTKYCCGFTNIVVALQKTVVALKILLNDKYKLESLQGDGSRTRQEIPQTDGCKARACNCCFQR